MKTFETPYVDVKKFDVKDVLTTSGETEEEWPYNWEDADCI